MSITLPCVTHIDLKGAPPKVNYLMDSIAFMKKCGSWGVMLEWEDTFPFKGDLMSIGSLGGCSREGMYSHEEVKLILQCVKENEMEPIQLVQTIGHLEYVLKHGPYRRLRELPRSPAVLCPSRPESLVLVKEMIAQVLEVQADAKYIHIGADEAWHMNACTDCQARSRAHQHGNMALYLDHIKAIATFIKAKYPNIKILMWDDMIRNVPVDVMEAYDLGELVIPVIWNYNMKGNFHFDTKMWERYSFVFSNVWAASAFKGADGSCQISCFVKRYASNQAAWHGELAVYSGKISFSGIILTGWSRYDHYATLCELLPVAMPSLAVCLQMWTRPDGFTNERLVSETLFRAQCPHEELTRCLSSFAELRTRALHYLNGDQVTTWLNEWQTDHEYTSPLQVESIADNVEKLQSELKAISPSVATSLHSLTGPRSAEEFQATYVESLHVRLLQLRVRVEGRKYAPAGITPNPTKD